MKLFLRALCALLLIVATSRAVPVTLRVADANSQPVAGANVEYADYADISAEKPNVAQTATTAANGTLTLDLRGVSGKPNEIVFQSNGKTVLGSARVRDAKSGYAIALLFAGENTLTLQETSRVQGTIHDATGTPLAGAQVTFIRAGKNEQDYSDASAQPGLSPIVATTNADGHWEIEDLPRGYARFKISAPGSASDGLNFWIDKTQTTAPELKMRAAGVVKGRIVDFGGRPLAAIYVNSNDYGDSVQSDAQGRFELPGVPVGQSALSFSNSAINPTPGWTGVTAEVKATIPSQNAMVDIGDVRADEGLLLTGSVVDDVTKAPVANVDLKLDAWNTTLQTDAQGHFEARVQKQFFGLKVQGNYNQKTIVPWSTEGADKFDVGIIEVERLGALFSGRVVDDKGAVAGARVGWNDNDKFEFVVPDAKGNFEIKNFPFKPLQISASDGARFLAATATPGTPVELKLSPATPLSDADIEKLWDQLKIRRISDLGRYTQALGARRVFETARRFDAATNPTQIGRGLDDYLSDRARGARTPAERESVAREGVELLRRFDVAAWSLGMGEIAMLAAQTGDEELLAFAARWYDAQKLQVKVHDAPPKIEWYDSALTERVMSVGAALGRDDATKYRDIWLSQIDKPNQTQYFHQYLPEWGETLWRADPRWFDEIVGAWPAPEQMNAIVGALKAEENPAQAKALLARLEKLASDPAVIAAAGDVTNSMGPISKSAEALWQGRTNFARSMALVDASAALDALDQVQAVIQSGETYEIAAQIARAAIADGHSEIARRALKLGLRDRYGGSGAPMLALIARPFDAELAAQLMEVARKNAMTNFSGVEPAGWNDVAAYAVALREFDAGAGRLMLEDQWAKRQKTPEKSKFDEDYAKQRLIVAQEKLAWAMAFYDLPRALQWLGEIKDNRNEWNNGLERTRLAILVAALTPPERRSLLLSATYFQ